LVSLVLYRTYRYIWSIWSRATIEDELKQMIRARNQEYFIQAKLNATTKLHQISPHNMLLEKKLEEFSNANHG
jgi:hypothetical protein